MEKVTEEINLVVGKFYLVPCAKLVKRFSPFKTIFVPIIGIKHKDVQFGVDYNHYHIDGRFSKIGDVYGVDSLGKTNGIIDSDNEKYIAYITEEIVFKKLKCKRLTTGIKPPDNSGKYHTWYKTMIGKSCAGKRCPHLGTMMLEEDGVFLCPLHGLIGDHKTNKIVSNKKVLC